MRWFLVILLLIISGCATIKISTVTQDGIPIKAEYTRWGNQAIEGFNFAKDPNGTLHFGFDKQLSETEIAFRLGQLSAGVGGGE